MTSVMALNSLEPIQQGEIARITQVCSDATYINITSIAYPNLTIAESDIEMTSTGTGEFYYEFNKTDQLGNYHIRGISDGCEKTFALYLPIKSNIDNISDQDNFPIYMLLILVVCIFAYIKVNKLLGSMGIMLMGFGVLFRESTAGWMGLIIMSIGLLSIIITLAFPEKKRMIRKRF